MNIALIPETRLALVNAILTTKANMARKRHSGPGGLLEFVKDFWHVLEPQTVFVDGWPLQAICEHLEAVTAGKITRLLMNVCPGFMKSLVTDVFWPAWEWGPMNMAHIRYVAFSYSGSLTERDNRRFGDLVSSTDYQELYGDRVKLRKLGEKMVSNSATGWKLASSVGGVGTGERGDRIILDDPHNVKEAESDIVRQETVRWFRESMSNRLNDAVTGAIVVIMQRVQQEDVSGVILEERMDYVHLMIPMEYDPSYQVDADGSPVETEIGWTDPRYDADDLDGATGTLAWPERFPPSACARLEKDVGPYAWCNPAEAPVLMADLSMKPISDVNVGDDIVGFEVKVNGGGSEKSRLQRAKVVSISKSIQPVVKMMLESGDVIRCTPNHKWYTARGEGRPTYAPASVGGRLMRVCPSRIDLPAGWERDAGWLAGFYDADGSTSVMQQRRSNARNKNSVLVSFTQNAGTNLPLCEKLEATLTQFGFEFNYKERKAYGKRQVVRQYYLTGNTGVPFYQKFLHLVRPVKWRDRLIEGAYGTKWIQARERVISIWPDGEETVYGLETTTGNYVVWGLASSNSGQYQQTPTPRGGGIFKTEWWQLWEPEDGKFPTFDYVLGSLDGAFTTKEENDPSALTIWGVFQVNGNRRIMLIHAWRKHLAFSGIRTDKEPNETQQAYAHRTQKGWGLMEWLNHTCGRFKVDKLLIEAKASGISAAQELQNRYEDLPYAIQLCPVKGDKVARAHAAQPTFSKLLVYAPAREWAEMVIEEMAVFPKGKYDDLTDSATQAIKYLRDTGMAQTDAEVYRQEIDALMPRSAKSKALYPV